MQEDTNQRTAEQQAQFEAAEAKNLAELALNPPTNADRPASEKTIRTPEQQAAFDAAEAKNLADNTRLPAPEANQEVTLDVQDTDLTPQAVVLN